MKKLLLIAAFAVVLPYCADAAPSVFDDAGSFAVAKAVKLGRGKAYKISGGQGFGSGGYNQQDKMCCAHCSSCDKTTGKCNGCEDGYTLQNNVCVEKTCDAHCRNCSKGICYDCESGYELKYGKCEKKVCGNGTYERNGDCVAICTGVSCNASQGYKAVAYNNSCCCELTSCAAGQYLSGTSCVSCPKGTYSAGGTETSCTSCPSGQTTDSTGATSSSACHTSRKTCEAGTYVNGDTCTPCPAGTYSSYPNASRCSSCDTIYTGSNTDVGKYYSLTKYNGTTCYSICNNCTATGVCFGSNFIKNQSSACFTPVSSGDGCPEGSTRKKMYFCNYDYGDGRTYDGSPFYVCDYGDYGKKCTKPSECKSGVCTGTSTLADSNHKCRGFLSSHQGSICH